MSRMRSPGYPSAPLQDVIDYAGKIHSKDWQHPVSREVAAQHMGFSGISGTSDRAISALMHFGLAEKSGKGELRVTDLAARLLHPDSPEEFREALQIAAFNPELFSELRARYPGEPPSLSGLSSYLSRAGFASAAIPPAAKAYLETCQFLQLKRAYESDGPADSDARESAPTVNRPEPPMQISPTVSPSPLPVPAAAYELNKPMLKIEGEEVVINGRLDRSGLKSLKDRIEALSLILGPWVEVPKTAGKSAVSQSDDD